MKDEEKTFIAERFGNGKGTDKELEEYKSLSDDLRMLYREICKRHPNWIHVQIVQFATWGKQQMRKDSSMRGVGFDIANSNRLTYNQKNELIRACENYFYKDVPFNEYQKSLLYRVRKEYHIVLTGLSEIANPQGILDVLFG